MATRQAIRLAEGTNRSSIEAEARSTGAATDVRHAIETISEELNHFDLSDDPGYIRVPTERVRAILTARLAAASSETTDD